MATCCVAMAGKNLRCCCEIWTSPTLVRLGKECGSRSSHCLLKWVGNVFALTVSIGVTAAASAESESVQAVVKRADEALYRAKRDGRNHLELANSTSARLGT